MSAMSCERPSQFGPPSSRSRQNLRRRHEHHLKKCESRQSHAARVIPCVPSAYRQVTTTAAWSPQAKRDVIAAKRAHTRTAITISRF